MDARFRGRQIGRLLLYDAMTRTCRAAIASAMLVVDPKDEAAAAFYHRYGFLAFGTAHRQLYLPIQEIRKIVEG